MSEILEDHKSAYKCPNCEGYKLPNFAEYKVGDEVMTYERSMRGNRVNESCREATIVSIVGDSAEIKFSNGKKNFWSLYGLTPRNAPTGIDYNRLGRCTCGG